MEDAEFESNQGDRLHSIEYRQNSLEDNVSAQVIKDKKRNLFLQISKTPICAMV